VEFSSLALPANLISHLLDRTASPKGLFGLRPSSRPMIPLGLSCTCEVHDFCDLVPFQTAEQLAADERDLFAG
jgi:hypothetical protein